MTDTDTMTVPALVAALEASGFYTLDRDQDWLNSHGAWVELKRRIETYRKGCRGEAVPLDFIGLNYYTTTVVADPGIDDGERRFRRDDMTERTSMGWPVDPSGLTTQLRRLSEDYGFDRIYVTENGAAYPDPVGPDGVVHDADRILYLSRHFRAALDAIAAGVPLAGYFVWSLMDNFEWALGYDRRFGLVHTDYDTLERTPKASYRWMQQVLSSGAVRGDPRIR